MGNVHYGATIGCFHMQPPSWAAKALDHIVCQNLDYGSFYYHKQTEVRLGNHLWVPDHLSNWHDSFSAYWISADGQYILRVSDHWSEGPKGVKTCGPIGQSYWTLNGKVRTAGVKHPLHSHPLWVGIAKLSEMKSIH